MAKGARIVLPAGTKVPDHIMIIPDGNRRWARAKGLDTLEGHRMGFEATTRLARAAREMGIHTMSLWGFSTENWDRTEREISYLMKLYESLVERHLKEAMEDGVRIIHLGRKDRIPKSLVGKISDAQEKTRNNQNYVLNICIDYGGRDEIVRAVNKMMDDRLQMTDEKTLAKYLDTADQPYPYVDLAIRTSGEQRTSGMLLWQAAYAEMYWEPDHFPDFTPEKLKEAVLDYSRRRRRFGGNDAEEHLKFNPRVVADLELKWRHELAMGPGEKFADYVMRYVKEQYGLSKDLAKDAGRHLAAALMQGKHEDWDNAKVSLAGLYDVVKNNLHLAFEPKIVANLEVNLWRDGGSEDKMREFLGEKFRFSELQAAKSAHLAVLANREHDPEKARGYLEKFYRALKERVA